MYKKLLCILLTLLLLCACASGPALPQTSNNPAPTLTLPRVPTPGLTPLPVVGKPALSLAEFPRIDGSTATIPLAQALVREITGCSEAEAEAAIQFSTTDASYYALSKQNADLLLVYEASPSVVQELDFESNFDLYPIGRDALVFLVNENNPVDSLTTKQLQDIYSGQITNWQQVGGIDAPIVAFQRPLLSGSQTMMQKLVMGEIALMDAPNDYYIPDMRGLVNAVAAYNNAGNAIGYSVYYYAKNMYTLPGLKLLRVDKTAPTEQSIAAAEYPFINEFFAVTRKGADANTKLLLNWLLSAGGQAFIARCGYVPMHGKALPPSAQEISDTPLWDENYYAVLPGENMIHLVWDCYGRQIGFFSKFGLGEYIAPGLYTAEELAERFLFADGRQADLANPTANQVTTRYANGFARFDWETGLLSMYDKQFNLRYTVQGKALPDATDGAYFFDTLEVYALGENELIFVRHRFINEHESLIPPQIRTLDGQLIATPQLQDADVRIVGTFAGQYLLGVQDRAVIPLYSIYDLDGKLLVRNANLVLDAERAQRYACDSYYKDGMIYGSDMRTGEAFQFTVDPSKYAVTRQGGFFENCTYNIEGTPSTGKVCGYGEDTYIYGVAGGRLKALRGGQIYNFPVDAPYAHLYDFNDTFVYIGMRTEENFYATDREELRFLQNGKILQMERYDSARIDAEYAVVWYYAQKEYVVYDANGMELLRVAGDEWRAPSFHHLRGGVFLREQGSYIGIVDIEGNWLVRTLRPMLAEDIDRWQPVR
ncbi:MAG: substrate-binding domain-containing protein [Clostridiales bacterium]|nr:substrate-binding domain-containing protein [Clostridiales bacterium]